jgi:hypothetical protein
MLFANGEIMRPLTLLITAPAPAVSAPTGFMVVRNGELWLGFGEDSDIDC